MKRLKNLLRTLVIAVNLIQASFSQAQQTSENSVEGLPRTCGEAYVKFTAEKMTALHQITYFEEAIRHLKNTIAEPSNSQSEIDNANKLLIETKAALDYVNKNYLSLAEIDKAFERDCINKENITFNDFDLKTQRPVAARKVSCHQGFKDLFTIIKDYFVFANSRVFEESRRIHNAPTGQSGAIIQKYQTVVKDNSISFGKICVR